MPTTVLRYADTPRRHKSRLRPEFPHYSSHTRDSQDLGPRGGKDLNNNEIKIVLPHTAYVASGGAAAD